MTPEPWSKMRLYALLRYGRKNSGAWDEDEARDLWGDAGIAGTYMPQDEDDAEGAVTLRNCGVELVDALIALKAERQLRLDVDDGPDYFDRLYALQESADTALSALAAKLNSLTP